MSKLSIIKCLVLVASVLFVTVTYAAENSSQAKGIDKLLVTSYVSDCLLKSTPFIPSLTYSSIETSQLSVKDISEIVTNIIYPMIEDKNAQAIKAVEELGDADNINKVFEILIKKAEGVTDISESDLKLIEAVYALYFFNLDANNSLKYTKMVLDKFPDNLNALAYTGHIKYQQEADGFGINEYQKYYDLVQKLQDQNLMISAQMQLANILVVNSKFAEAQASYEKALNTQNLQCLPYVYGGLATIAYLQKNYEQAINYSKKALTSTQEAEQTLEIQYYTANIYSTLANIYTVSTKPTAEIENALNNAYSIYSNFNDNVETTYVLIRLANLYIDNNDYLKAEEQYNLLLDYYGKENDKNGVAESYLNLAHVMGKLEKPTEAKKYLEKALDIYKQLNNTEMRKYLEGVLKNNKER